MTGKGDSRDSKDAPGTLERLREEGLIRRLMRSLPAQAPDLLTGIGDDCAVMPGSGPSAQVFTIDLLVEGTHFTTATMGSARLLGRKALSVNVSDVAAMGARPTTAVIGLSAPGDTTVDFIREFYKGLGDACRRYGCVIAGGDTTRGEQICLSVALNGLLEGDGEPALRQGARSRDWLYVTGWPGESAAGLALLMDEFGPGAPALPEAARKRLIRRHQDPDARVNEGRALRANSMATAMVDVSDGLVHEAILLSQASKARIVLEEQAIPLSRALEQMGAAGRRGALEFALYGGEDYELLFTSPDSPDEIRAVLQAAGSDCDLHRIGFVEKGAGVYLQSADGARQPCRHRGFEHFDHA